MPARPQTLVLYLSTDSCSVLSTCWGLYYYHVAPALVGTSAYDKPKCYIFKSGLNTEVNITRWRGNSTPFGDPYAYNQIDLQDWFLIPFS